jgi:hypothetical protein
MTETRKGDSADPAAPLAMIAEGVKREIKTINNNVVAKFDELVAASTQNSASVSEMVTLYHRFVVALETMAKEVASLRRSIVSHTTALNRRLDDMERGQLRFGFLSSPPQPFADMPADFDANAGAAHDEPLGEERQ